MQRFQIFVGCDRHPRGCIPDQLPGRGDRAPHRGGQRPPLRRQSYTRRRQALLFACNLNLFLEQLLCVGISSLPAERHRERFSRCLLFGGSLVQVRAVGHSRVCRSIFSASEYWPSCSRTFCEFVGRIQRELRLRTERALRTLKALAVQLLRLGVTALLCDRPREKTSWKSGCRSVEGRGRAVAYRAPRAAASLPRHNALQHWQSIPR